MKQPKMKIICEYKGCKNEVWYGVCNGYCEKHHNEVCMGKTKMPKEKEKKEKTEYTDDIFFLKECKKCKAKIRWLKTKNGKWMPVDIDLITIITMSGETIKGYIPHWATCSSPDYFRKNEKLKADPDGGMENVV